MQKVMIIPHEKLLRIRRVTNPSTNIDLGWLKTSFLVLIQNASFVRDIGTNYTNESTGVESPSARSFSGGMHKVMIIDAQSHDRDNTMKLITNNRSRCIDQKACNRQIPSFSTTHDHKKNMIKNMNKNKKNNNDESNNESLIKTHRW